MMHDVGYNLVWSTHSSLVRPGWPGGQTAYKKRLVRRFIDLLCGDLSLLAFKAHQGTNLHRIDLAVMDFMSWNTGRYNVIHISYTWIFT